jgi:hypothetical protein
VAAATPAAAETLRKWRRVTWFMEEGLRWGGPQVRIEPGVESNRTEAPSGGKCFSRRGAGRV